LHEAPGQARTNHLGQRVAEAQLGVALHQPLAPDERRQKGGGRQAGDEGQRGGQEADYVQPLHPQQAEHGREWDGADQCREPQVGGDQHRTPSETVYPDPRDQTDQQHGGALEGAEQPHLHGRRAEHQDGGERQGKLRDRRAHQRDRLPGPDLQELVMAPQAAELHPTALSQDQQENDPTGCTWTDW
jgi:hypothetical protein